MSVLDEEFDEAILELEAGEAAAKVAALAATIKATQQQQQQENDVPKRRRCGGHLGEFRYLRVFLSSWGCCELRLRVAALLLAASCAWCTPRAGMLLGVSWFQGLAVKSSPILFAGVPIAASRP